MWLQICCDVTRLFYVELVFVDSRSLPETFRVIRNSRVYFGSQQTRGAPVTLNSAFLVSEVTFRRVKFIAHYCVCLCYICLSESGQNNEE